MLELRMMQPGVGAMLRYVSSTHTCPALQQAAAITTQPSRNTLGTHLTWQGGIQMRLATMPAFFFSYPPWCIVKPPSKVRSVTGSASMAVASSLLKPARPVAKSACRHKWVPATVRPCFATAA